MKELLLFAFLVAVLFYAGAYILCAARRRGLVPAANAVGEGFHEDGKLNLFPDAAITARYSLVKLGSDNSHIAVTAAATDIPLGICTDSTDVQTGDITKPLAVNALGAVRGTQRGIAAGTIATGAFLVPAANGQVQTLPAAAGSYYIVGRYVGAGATVGNYVEFTPCFPTLRIVT